MIRQDLLEKYNMLPKEEYESPYHYYQTFLQQTDYITNKMLEEYISGKSKTDIKAKYKEIIEAREYARSQINEVED